MTPIRIVFRAARDATGAYMSSWRCLSAEETAASAASPDQPAAPGFSLGDFCEWPLRRASNSAVGGELDQLSHA